MCFVLRATGAPRCEPVDAEQSTEDEDPQTEFASHGDLPLTLWWRPIGIARSTRPGNSHHAILGCRAKQ